MANPGQVDYADQGWIKNHPSDTPGQARLRMEFAAAGLMGKLKALSAVYASMGDAELAADMELAYLDAKLIREYLANGG